MAVLVIEDGTIVTGQSFGARRTVYGELVFNTGMTGYQEALTDPSYRGQVLMMTYPLTGNYGIEERISESDRIKCEAFVVREACGLPSHRASESDISSFLSRYDIPGISNVDTRALTIKTRVHGTMRCAVSTEDEPDTDELLAKVKTMPYPEKRNLVGEVSCRDIKEHGGKGKLHIGVIDCGTKMNTIRELMKVSKVTQFPYDATHEEIMKRKVDGILISNGPGDPSHPDIVKTTAKTIQSVAGEVPVMGICLGHQITSVAFGAKTFKMKFGHRGSNQAVIDVKTRNVSITSQNHGFAVDEKSCTGDLKVAEINVNDRTVEGVSIPKLGIRTYQYHPEASPGPHDTEWLFERFREIVQGV